MPDTMKRRWVWFATVFGLYVALVIAAALAFQWMRQAGIDDSSPRMLIVCGPAMALFTHMSYVLFLGQTLLFIPWMLLGSFAPKTRLVAIIALIATWLGIGWRMFELF